MEPQEQSPQDMMQDASQGRGGDTVMAHLSLGELVIPRAFLDDPQVMQMMQQLFQQGGANINEYMVGDPANKINPETGYPEFFKLGKIFKTLAPLAAAYFAPGIGGFLNTGLGLGLTGASSIAALGGAAGGLASGALTGGGLKGALTGAALGGAGGYLSNGGLGELGITGQGSLLGEAAQGQGPTLSGAALNGNGSGILGKLTTAASSVSNALPSIGGITGGLGGGGGSSFSPLNAAAAAFGGASQNSSIKKQQEQLLGANQTQLANLETFDPSGITGDPGYQFNLEQGQRGLDQSLAASGGLQSGAALKAAARYNQDYANNAFNDYYQRWASKVGSQNALYGAGGDIQANATGAGAQNLSQSLSNALGAQVGNYGGQLGGLTAAQKRALGLA